ncbi:MAG TPA: SET domain-containing protein-lysine N-methyltransferase [Gemmatimonadales bacterium]|jgi:hypothetical protein
MTGTSNARPRGRAAGNRPRKKKIEVRESTIQGRGVWAAAAIAKGDWIVEYSGERISHAEADMRYDDESMSRHHTFLFIVDSKTCIDAASGGNEARLINHSCEPNCEAILSAEDREIWIVALRKIEKGEELTYDYGYVMDGESIEEALRKYPCTCGAPKCRGTILRLA